MSPRELRAPIADDWRGPSAAGGHAVLTEREAWFYRNGLESGWADMAAEFDALADHNYNGEHPELVRGFRQAAIVIRHQLERSRQPDPSPPPGFCALERRVSGEPFLCGYEAEHRGPHSWELFDELGRIRRSGTKTRLREIFSLWPR